MREPYTCPECQTEHDHAEAEDAACRSCGRCPECAPSELVGDHEDCDACRGIRAGEPDFTGRTQDEMGDIQDAVMREDARAYQKLTGHRWEDRPVEWVR